MTVYAVAGWGTRMVKIGYSHNFELRLAQLQASSPIRLVPIWLQREGDAYHERRMHEHFAPLRDHGEWFDFTSVDDVLAELDHAWREVMLRLPPPREYSGSLLTADELEAAQEAQRKRGGPVDRNVMERYQDRWRDQLLDRTTSM